MSTWRDYPMPRLFDEDFQAWLKSLSREARPCEAMMQWQDLGPFAIDAYNLHRDMASTCAFLATRNRLPHPLPDECTPQGFYLKAVEARRQHVGIHHPFVVTPYERLSAFSQFLYRRMAGRIAEAAGRIDDGLDDFDDGLGDGL